MKRTITVTIIHLFLIKAHAQDTHYWGSAWGTGGFFAPGAVLSYNGDSSVLFYNPALLSHQKQARLSVNANIYYYERINVKNGVGTGRPLTSVSSGSNPLMLAGNFLLKGKHPINIAYGLISTPVIDFEATQRRDEMLNVLDDSYSPGSETFVGQFITQNNIRRFTGIAGAGIKLSPRTSAGLYIEGGSRKQLYQLNYIARALVNPPGNAQYQLVSTDINYYVSYNHYSLRLKAGFAWDGDKDHFGLLIQSPAIGIAGKAVLVADEVVSNTRFANMPLSFVANTRQDQLPVTWKEPMSIGIGYTRQLNRAMFYIAGEYALSLNEYNIITPRSTFFIRPDTGQNNLFTKDLLKLKDARRAVWNISVGMSFPYNEKIMLYATARTDRTYLDRTKFANDDGFVPYTASWNIYHLQCGINMGKAKYNLRLGIYASYGSDNSYKQEINFDNPSESNFLTGDISSAKASYFAAGVLVSYLYKF